ncbi:MAG TPA: N-acetylmuramoyl-L-alanine amidase [Bryobacteraceae bacterium]|jgi:N-acetylmuramoyl-L-alanine amidase|nr:N-acetylmuramoyl-L-alanine amidase [Bryobacteraceae bacterium]
MKLLASIAVSVPLLMVETAHAQLHSVTAVRHWAVGDVTRVAIEVSGEFQFRSDRLHNPERIYFDILNARPRLEHKLSSDDISDKFLRRVRMAETTPGVTRVVLELGDGVEATPSQLLNPYRLMVELRVPAPATTPAASPLAPTPPPVTTTTTLPPAPKLTVAVKADVPRVEVPAPPKALERIIAEPPPAAEPSKAQISHEGAPPANSLPLEAKVEPSRVPETLAPTVPAHAEKASSARPTTSTGQNSLIRALGLKINRVVIDPGHGGQDQGTAGPKGLLEKELVLDVAKRLGKLIEDRMGAEVIYTRSDDTFIPLEGRTALANEKKADLFLSIHANSSPATHVAGIETYYLNFTDSKDALDVAARENAVSEKSVFELRDLIQKITLHDKAEESREFAGRIQGSLFALSARNFPGEKNRGVRKAPFVVLIGANMPSVLAEIGFLSNPKEESLLKKPDYRDKLAEALYRGLSRYAGSLSHFQVAQAQN